MISRFSRIVFGLFAFSLAVPPAWAQWNPLNPVTAVERQTGGVTLTMKTGTLHLAVLNDSMIHVLYSPVSTFSMRPDYVVTKNQWPVAPWTFDSNDTEVSLTTPKLKVRVVRANGAIAFSDASGKPLMQDATRRMWPVEVNGERTYHAEEFISMYGSEEGFYGLGQHQAGVWNYRGESVELAQENTQIAVPLLLSSKGYGIFWNNTSRTRFDNHFVHSLYISSEVADQIDYYFLYGPDFDRMIAEYRELTGAAPLFGKWAYGFWQCKNRYQSQQELLDVAAKYRGLKIPVDDIVQDWFWWTNMGSFKFSRNYPDPKGMVDELHREHFHLMISIWPYFYPGSPVYDEMDKRGFFVAKTAAKGFHPQGMALYDATNPKAAIYYWNLVNQSLLQIGLDAWWMDTDEPETEGQEENILLNHQLFIGSGARYANIYPLIDTGVVSQGQRSETDKNRVFILSRSAFAGIQRNGVTAWSGDVLSDWESFRRQIPAGLNFMASGIPYWTTDIGGFHIGNPDDPKYRELFVRWFEYGSFCPIFRVHGTRTTNQNELWSYGPDAQTILTSFDRLRYRLLPYIYSVAWMTTHDSYTPMRPLVMDFQNDAEAMNVGDQFMFGPAILVNPVTEPGAASRRLYLPGRKWYDFWTGAAHDGGKRIDAAAPIDRIPLFVRAGSILPMGTDVQYSSEKPADPIEVRVYPGADGSFTLYEDENDNYDYQKGVYATIPFRWDDATQTLIIGKRAGSFPGMLQKRTFHIVFVNEGHGVGIEPTALPDKVVTYSGDEMSVSR
jgi:alpha-D-xyloside xylohydrolase